MTVPAHHFAVLVLPDVFPLELGIAAQIFGSERQYRLTVCTPVPARAVPTSGFTITATAGLDALSGADTVIVPGYQDVEAPVPADALTALQAAHRRGARLVSICAGAFALAAAGVTAGVDVCLHLFRTDHGAAAATACARALVAPPQRAGGQAQYIERLV